MQFMINADTDPTTQLRAVAALLVIAADTRDVAPARPEGFRTDEEILNDSTGRVLGDDLDPAAIFGKTTPPAAPPPATAPPPVGAPPPPAAEPPPAAVVPSQTAAQMAGEVDSAGVTYDPLVHSSSHAKVSNGTWKKRRNGAAKPVVVAPPPTVAEPARLPSTASVAGNDQVGAAVAAVAPPPVAPPPVAAPPADPTVPTFRTVTKKATDAMGEGKLSASAVLALVQAAGSPDLQTLNTLAHLIPAVNAALDAALAGKWP